MNETDLHAVARELRVMFDARRYLDLYEDVRASGADPLTHYLLFGADEGREPCAQFDGAWYRTRYPDVAAANLNPLLHYVRHGGMEMRDPNPNFDAVYYVDAHPEAIGNPLLYHLLHGQYLDWPIQPRLDATALLPSPARPAPAQAPETVDIVIPVYRGEVETRRCIASVLADPDRPPGRIFVIDDKSPERALIRWLGELAVRGQIVLLRNPRNLGFVRSVNAGITAAGENDVVLLNSDTEVPPGWLRRLGRAAHARPDIASVSPFSNNATICSYPNETGGPLPAGQTLAAFDAACQQANAQRIVDLPTTVGFCMYLRRDALRDVGVFDAEAFGHGYGEEVDFCQRARARGWRHVLACDVFVYHQGEVSFGAASAHARKGQEVLRARYPNFDAELIRYARLRPAVPARFALTAALFRQSGLPGILFISHGLGGGVLRQMQDMVTALQGKANILLLQPDTRGVSLSVPAIKGHPVLSLTDEHMDVLTQYLHSAAIRRVHIHHLMNISVDVQALIRHLGVPFDLTVHDYFGICPQVNLLPVLDAQYCGEPDTRHCNACIAARPNNGATDIDSWRWGYAWMFQEAARVICPSEDTRARLLRHGLGKGTIVVPHEPVDGRAWPLAPIAMPATKRRGAKLKIALLGVLADRKGLATVRAVAEANQNDIALHLIGHLEQAMDPHLADRLTESGVYEEAALPELIARVQPHVFWFPAQWPETYSYTLSAAIQAGGAIVAADLGAFSERLRGRPLTWLVPADAPTQAWLDAFAAARQALSSGRIIKKTAPRVPVADYYQDEYLTPLRAPARRPVPARAKRARRRILLIPERLDNGGPSPCAYIRLLQPLHHPAIATGCNISIADGLSALDEAADTIITQRHAMTDPDDAAALVAHCRRQNIRLIYDLDDDLLKLPDGHPDAGRLRPLEPAIRRMLEAADTVWLSTPALAARLGRYRAKLEIVGNGLDERLWWPPITTDRPINGPIRLLYMGTGTHDADLAILLPALEKLHTAFGDRVATDIIGVTSADLPAGLNRINVPRQAMRTYPAFVNWLSLENKWHIGLAPLADTAFNRGKSAIKAMDYAALGLPTIASRIGVYDPVIDHGGNGLLVANTTADWFTALAGLVRDPRRRQGMAAQARAAFDTGFTLASQAARRRRVLFGR